MTFLVFAFVPAYRALRDNTACWFETKRVTLYGPEPITLPSACSRRAEKSCLGTIAPAVWVRMYGHVPSACLRCIVTVFALVASTRARLLSSDAGPDGSAIRSTRSSENFTSAAVSRSPLENFSPLRSVHTYVFEPLNAQRLAASGLGSLPPAGIVK